MQEKSGIIVVGSLNPTKICQDECLVYGEGGVCPALRARDYKGAIKILIECEQDGAEKCQKESSGTEDI